MIKLPNRIFFTGVPGSKWSGIAQVIEQLSGMNTSDRTSIREYSHNQYSGHKGAYFGPGMEFEAYLEPNYLDQAWTEKNQCKVVKSHVWAYKLDDIKKTFPNDWIMLIYRPDFISYAWWNQAGGFSIKYPDYSHYNNQGNVLAEISNQNLEMLKFGFKNNLKWEYFTAQWVKENFDQNIGEIRSWEDVLVTLLK